MCPLWETNRSKNLIQYRRTVGAEVVAERQCGRCTVPPSGVPKQHPTPTAQPTVSISV